MEDNTKKKLVAVGIVGAILGYLWYKPKVASAQPTVKPTTPTAPTSVVIPGTNIQVPAVGTDEAYKQAQQILSNAATDTFQITTADPPPAGNLNVRSGPSTANPMIGQFGKNTVVKKVDGPQNGWLKVSGVDVNSGQPLVGWVSGLYLRPVSPSSIAQAA